MENRWGKFDETGVGILMKVDKHIKINNPNFIDPEYWVYILKSKDSAWELLLHTLLTESHGTDEQKRQFYANLKTAVLKMKK